MGSFKGLIEHLVAICKPRKVFHLLIVSITLKLFRKCASIITNHLYYLLAKISIEPRQSQRPGRSLPVLTLILPRSSQ